MVCFGSRSLRSVILNNFQLQRANHFSVIFSNLLYERCEIILVRVYIYVCNAKNICINGTDDKKVSLRTYSCIITSVKHP